MSASKGIWVLLQDYYDDDEGETHRMCEVEAAFTDRKELERYAAAQPGGWDNRWYAFARFPETVQAAGSK